MEYIPVRVSDIIRQVNRDIFLPAIQREFVWGTDRIERLFDSIMADFPIGSFLYWKLEQKNKDEWPVYELGLPKGDRFIFCQELSTKAENQNNESVTFFCFLLVRHNSIRGR